MYKILTVDDETDFTELIKNYFEPRGYEVFTANEGSEGLRIAFSKKPDICLIDVKMPGMHGDEVLKEILKKDPKAKCIIITASEGDGKTRTKLMNMGAYKCFDKPLSSLKDLEKAVKEAMNNEAIS